MNRSGITLVELVVVVAVIGILVVALGFSYQGWQGKYKVEQAIRELHSDMLNARNMAISRSRYVYVNFISSTTYSIIVDNDDNLTADDTPEATYPKTVAYPLAWAFSGSGSMLTFDRKGLVNLVGSIYITSDSNPDYDCITIHTTRINVGKWSGSSCAD